MLTYQAATATIIRELRHRVLRPHQRPEELVYPGDDWSDTLHAGAFDGDTLVGISTISRQAPPETEDATAWRIRGMAVLPELQGQGVGRRLFEMCCRHMLERGGTWLWANARVNALAFYRSVGCTVVGDEFDIPGIGPHFQIRWQPESE
jgi:GNAT superfamily N-acetyltransferase